MQLESVGELLSRLNDGDEAAAEQAFVEFGPYLQKVVSRLMPPPLRSKFDSVDIVQSVYGDVLAAFRAGGLRFESPAQLRAFLIRATRNRFIDRARQHARAAKLEQRLGGDESPGPAASMQPRPSQDAVAGDLWERLLAISPPEHHELLRRRRRGETAREIARDIGLHEGSVRRILRDLALKLACSTAATSKANGR